MRLPLAGERNQLCVLCNNASKDSSGTNSPDFYYNLKIMELLLKSITISHVLAGIIALVVGPVALFVMKGGNVHRASGKIFFWAMTWIFLSAVCLSIYKWIPFLLMIAFFSYYSVIIGYRSIYQKQLHQGKGIMWYDWVALIISGLFNNGFVIWGVYLAYTGQLGFFAYLSIAFGMGGLIMVIGQIKSFLSPPLDKHRWLYAHIGNMTGGFIAAVTAFSTQVMTFLPGVIQWIWPALVGVPISFYWISTYQRKLRQNVRLVDLVELKR